ncbi:tail protein [Pseudomonas sp. Pc102]|uniref:phage tail assembly protein n=1 Tax=Pseudomonas sp. Pc102 TaxID=2678261 RepID=UPI001BCC97E2|nr:phage tail assembly protein [Pseudomonas sp. Pc102]BBP86012.1 tail protein [Pseudomonas sp. Pc102]
MTTPTDNVVQLDTPIKRGEQKITQLDLRKPQAGELRGVHLGELLQLDVNSLIKVIPRISIPTLTEPEVAAMDLADLLAVGTKVAGFLLQKAARTEASLGA